MARNLPQQLRYDKLGPNVVKALTKRHFEAYYCSTKEEALAQAIKLIPEKDVVSWGGSISIDEINLLSYVKEHYQEKIPTYVECGDSVRDVNILYDNTITFIQASRRETFSYAVCEAVFAGLPVISSSIPGLEWAQEIPTVLFFKKEDIDGLYECMKKIVNETWLPDEQEIANSRAVIKNKFSLNIWCEKIIEMYKSYL